MERKGRHRESDKEDTESEKREVVEVKAWWGLGES
jgi:hypothetical protein